MKIKQKQKNILVTLQEKCVKTYLLLMIICFPLYYKNNYINILRAKKSFYITTTMLFVAVMIILECMCRYWKEKEEYHFFREKGFSKKMYIFIVVTIIGLLGSIIVSQYPQDAFAGLTGRFMGSNLYLLGLLVMFFISKYVKWDVTLTWSFLIGNTIVYIVQILNCWGNDVLKMKQNLLIEQHKLFTGTIGNLNFNAVYNSMTIVIGMVLFILCQKKISVFVYGCFIFLGFCASICCRSDSIFLGLGAAFLVLFWYVLVHKNKLWRFWWEMVLLFLSFLLLSFCYYQWREKAGFFDGLLLQLLQGRFLSEMVIFIIFAAIVFAGMGKLCIEKMKWIQRIFGIFTLGMILLLFFTIGIINMQSTKEGTWSFWHIQDNWGNNRGYVWKRTWQAFRTFSFSNQLLGCGSNCLSYILDEMWGNEMVSLFGAKFIDAHNEYLQILATIGITGAVGYFGIIITLLRESISQIKEKEGALFSIAGIIVFLALGLVNNLQVTNLPILFIQLGIFWHILRKQNNPSSSM